MFTLVSDLRAAGLKVGLLSNSWGNTYPRDRIDGAFDNAVTGRLFNLFRK